MTTLAIIGAGIAGRSLLYTLKNSSKKFDKILVFYSDSFASPCSINSTSIVAPRGVTAGLSDLGDLLQEGYATFKFHVEKDSPVGVTKITQYTGAYSKLEQFQKRYPAGLVTDRVSGLKLKEPTYIAQEEAFMIDPKSYMDWLLNDAKSLPLEIHDDFVIGIETGDEITIKTISKKEFRVDHLLFTTGAASRFWKPLSSNRKWQSSKSVQGSYLEFSDVSLNLESLSLTLEGNNFIYDAQRKKLLIGSTTQDTFHELANAFELKSIYQELSDHLDISLPAFEEAKIRVGLREKASKREPYLISEKNLSMIGGLYKNGYSASLLLSHRWLKLQS